MGSQAESGPNVEGPPADRRERDGDERDGTEPDGTEPDGNGRKGERADLAAWSEALAAADGSPGVDGAAAAVAAGGLALVSMAFRGDDREERGEDLFRRARAAELDALRDRARHLLQGDRAAREVLEGATDATRPRRVREWAEVPVEIAELALAGLRLAAAGAAPAARAEDRAGGAVLLGAAVEAAALGFRRRARCVEDPDWVRRTTAAVEVVRRQAHAIGTVPGEAPPDSRER